MEKEDWRHTNKALIAFSTRLSADIKKHVESLQLTGLVDPIHAAQHRTALFAAVADARLHLQGLQKQVHEGQSTPSFIQALASRISGFTELINTLKASQRQQYASLLQQEQQLLQELQAVHIADDADPLQQDDCSQDSSSEQHPVSSGWQDSDAVGSRYRNDSPNKHRQQSHHNCSTSQPQQWSSKAAKAVTPRRVNSRAGTTDNTAAHNSSSDLLPEVVAYNNFLARHGPTGGWHPDDHNTFMSVLRSSRGDYSAAVPAAADALPMHTRQAIIAHCRWHADFTELDMRRRVALVNWRAAKDAAKSAMRAEAAALQNTSIELPHPTDVQLEKEVRQLQKQRVEQWKQQKQQALQQQEQLEAMEQQQQREQQQRKLQEKREALKQRLEELKAVKQQQAAAAAAEAMPLQATEASRCLSSEVFIRQQELQQRLRQRSSATFGRRQQLMAAKLDKQAARERAQQQLIAELEAVKPKVERDPSRLLAATAAAAARASTMTTDTEEPTAGDKGLAGRGSISSGFVLHLGHKAVPSWASGMR